MQTVVFVSIFAQNLLYLQFFTEFMQRVNSIVPCRYKEVFCNDKIYFLICVLGSSWSGNFTRKSRWCWCAANMRK